MGVNKVKTMDLKTFDVNVSRPFFFGGSDVGVTRHGSGSTNLELEYRRQTRDSLQTGMLVNIIFCLSAFFWVTKWTLLWPLNS